MLRERGGEEEEEEHVSSKSISPRGCSPEYLERRKEFADMICKEGVMCPQSGMHGAFFQQLFAVDVTVSDAHFPHTEHQLPLCQLRVSLH